LPEDGKISRLIAMRLRKDYSDTSGVWKVGYSHRREGHGRRCKNTGTRNISLHIHGNLFIQTCVIFLGFGKAVDVYGEISGRNPAALTCGFKPLAGIINNFLGMK